MPEGGQPIHIDVAGPPAGTPWARISVSDGAGNRIDTQKSKYAFIFTPQAGKSYHVRALQGSGANNEAK